MVKRKPQADRIAELQALADSTAEAALGAEPAYQTTVLNAAETIKHIASNMSRKNLAPAPAVLTLPDNATAQELRSARTKQAARRGQDVYLPNWSSTARALPDVFLRTALFSSSSSVQKQNDQVLAGDLPLVVTNDEIASFSGISFFFSGYRLCQYDRQVYATCLDYYREQPLATDDCPRHIRTSFHAFASRMGGTHNAKTYRSIRASLLRLSFAQIRLRSDCLNIEVPKLLSVGFEDDHPAEEMKGANVVLLCVPEPVAELFGVASWTAIDRQAVDYDGLRGWLANFYATHKKAKWLPIETLYRLSGYESKMSNFRGSVVKALDKLKEPGTPVCSRVAKYHFSKDKTRLYVVREAWPTNDATEE